ncbi:MAG: ArnT family glycosyltransferase [Xanthobacteraceae bacterium]
MPVVIDSTRAETHARFARICDALAIIVLFAVAVVALLTFRDYGLGWDDYTHSEYGDLLLKLFGSGFTNRDALTFVNLYAYGGGFDVFTALVAKISPFDLWETRRLCGAIVGLIGLAATWRIGRRIGGPLAGLIALDLLATCPLYFGHMFFNPKDAPFAVAMAIALLGLVRVLQEYPRPTAPTVALFGIGFGLAIGTRVLGGLAPVYAVFALLLIAASNTRTYGMRDAGHRIGEFILLLLPAVVVGYATMALVWPWGVVEPLNPIRAVEYFAHFFEQPWRELFAGELILVPEMPRRYVPQLFALKLPELFLLLGSIGVLGALIGTMNRHSSPQRRAALLVTALAAVVPVAITVATRPAMYNGVRHFVFVIPPMAALGGYAGAALILWLNKRQTWAAAIVAAIMVAGIASPIVEMVRLHPYEYTYFNHIAGGIRGADGRYMRDYWGLSFKQASQELLAALATRHEEPPAGRHWRIAVCGPHRPAEVGLGPQFDISWDPKGADFAMTLGEFYCAKLDAPLLAKISREGVVYARLYDIRGKNFSTLLTIPAP